MEGFENIPLPKLPGTEFYNPLDLARPRPQVFKVVNGIAGNYGEVNSTIHKTPSLASVATDTSLSPCFAVLRSAELSSAFRSRAKEALGGEVDEQESHTTRLVGL